MRIKGKESRNQEREPSDHDAGHTPGQGEREGKTITIV